MKIKNYKQDIMKLQAIKARYARTKMKKNGNRTITQIIQAASRSLDDMPTLINMVDSLQKEIADVEIHLEMFLGKEEMERIGATEDAGDHKRDFNFRIMRVLSHYADMQNDIKKLLPLG